MTNPGMYIPESRLILMRRLKKMLMIFAALLLLLAADVYFETHVPKLVRVEVETEKLPPGAQITILQATDLHNAEFSPGNRKLLARIEELDPDLIAVTGDLIDRNTTDLQKVLSFAGGLQQINPETYFVSGNHEWDHVLHEPLLQGLQERQIKILNNAGTVWTKENLSINLLGVDDSYSGMDDLEQALQGVDDLGRFNLLLSHSQDILDREGVEAADLILSGHSHGGQIRLPFIGAVVAPGQGLFPTYDKGMFEIDADTRLYVDSGLGTSTIPIRFLNRSQFTLITLKGKS